ncbi:hypothetical protein V6N13_047647 [Hibiscus sabdariffa]|uniref:Uncharacterized protein n=1 Tax=Hibiscus sabdariffa TaxID=183260 RepID=A0ABR2F4V6_9ROSI
MSDDTPAPPCAWIAMPSTFNVMFHINGTFLFPSRMSRKKVPFQIYSDEEPFETSAASACMARSAAPISLMQSPRAESFTIILRNLLSELVHIPQP